MIISDPKGELFEYTSGLCQRLGYEVLTLDLKTPLKSSKYNFLQPVIDQVNKGDVPKAVEKCADIAESLVGEVGNREAIWVNGEKSVIKSAIMAVVMENQDHPEYQNLPNVHNFLRTMCAEGDDKKMLIDTFLDNLEKENPNHPAIHQFGSARLAPSKTRGSFFSSAMSTLSLFVDDYIASMLSRNEIDIEKSQEHPTVIYMILPDEKTTYYTLCSLFVNQTYGKLVELADARGGRLKIRTNFILDEFGNFSAIPNFGGFLTVGGGRGIRFNLFIQSFSQLNDKYGDNVAQNIMDNCHVWTYLKTSNSTTAETISKKLGTYTTSSWSESNSSSGGAVNRSSSMNLSQRSLLTPDEVLRIERPYLLVMLAGNNPSMNNSPDLSKWNFNNVLGLGDPAWCTQIRELREYERLEKKIEPVKYWTINKDIEKQLEEEKEKQESKKMKNVKRVLS